MVYLRENIRFLYAVFIPVILIIGNQSLQNKHAHFFSNEIIVHSHPFEKNSKDSAADHKHTKAEIYFYGLIGFDYYSHSGEQCIETTTCNSPGINVSSEKNQPYIVWLYNTDSRDPPAGIS